MLLALVLAGTGCTDGGWLDQTRLSFYTQGIDTPLAGEERTNSSLPEMVSRGNEVLAVLDLETPTLQGGRAAHSADNGRSWQPVLFDGKADPGMDLVSVAAVRSSQWLLVGHRNGQVFAFISSDGTNFTLQQAPIFETTGTRLNAVVGTDEGWLIAASPDSGSGGAATTLFQSSDGAAWSGRDGSASGLPAARGTFHPLSMAASPSTIVLVGQEVPHDRPPFARAFASSDGGNSWQDVSPDTGDVGPAGNALWTVAWSGNDFRVTGHAWPRDARPKRFPLGMSGSWTPGGVWNLQADAGWSRQDHDFPRGPGVAYGAAGALATQMIGQLADGEPRVLFQPPGQAWSELGMPQQSDAGLQLYGDVTAVEDGFLVVGTSSRHGNDGTRLWHVDGSGNVTGRDSPLTTAAPTAAASGDAHVTSILSSGGKTIAFGSVRSQPAFWELQGEQDFRNYTTLVGQEDQTLDTMAAGPRGEMLLGESRTANGHLPVIWSRTESGDWSVHDRSVFGAGTSQGKSEVRAVLPSRHGFLAAGSYDTEGATHAGLAVSEDGDSWSEVQSAELRGAPTAGRSIGSLAETPSGTVLAGGSVDDHEQSDATVWASTDAHTWKPVQLPRPEGYATAQVVSLTPGPLRTVAVVHSSGPGKPARFDIFSSGDDGRTWEQGPALEATSQEHSVARPRLAANGDGFVLLATRGPAGQAEAVLMLSKDGREFTTKDLGHDAFDQEGLAVSAVGVAGKKLLVTGVSGPPEARRPFGIAVDVPSL
ncbi:hypothetical protein [Arthrobacter sp. S39]|uniref:hypothetical protein n=1 Tax=Arthrobacter sp. S39 TaxID=2509720 RepID=UPI001036FC63|nr:hypothetical protein [Arthrobacter sp. S39]TAP43988.1 hypothetical protein EYS21_10260 [Arthrobacter sp. S39]